MQPPGLPDPMKFIKSIKNLLFTTVYSCSRPQRLIHPTPAAFSSDFAPAENNKRERTMVGLPHVAAELIKLLLPSF